MNQPTNKLDELDLSYQDDTTEDGYERMYGEFDYDDENPADAE